MSQIRLIAIRDTELSVDEVRDAIADPAAGGEVLFIGTVRDNDADRGVTALSYTRPSVRGSGNPAGRR